MSSKGYLADIEGREWHCDGCGAVIPAEALKAIAFPFLPNEWADYFWCGQDRCKTRIMREAISPRTQAKLKLKYGRKAAIRYGMPYSIMDYGMIARNPECFRTSDTPSL